MDRVRFNQSLALAVFVAVAVGVSSALAAYSVSAGRLLGAQAPWFMPPAGIFAPIWTVLFFCIAIAGWLVWRRAPRSTAMGAWAAQMLLNWLWAPVFFRAGWFWPGAVIVAALFVTILAFIGLAERVDRRASYLFVPYALWVAFSMTLNFAFIVLN